MPAPSPPRRIRHLRGAPLLIAALVLLPPGAWMAAATQSPEAAKAEILSVIQQMPQALNRGDFAG